jgi:HSP20 family protein
VTDLFNEGAADLAEDAHRLLLDIDKAVPGAATTTADCRPSIDVIETATALEVVVDIPGVPAEAVRVAIRKATLLVVGSKPVGPVEPRARYHLAERGYGRFARAVRLTGAFDGRRASAVVSGGQLRVILPLLTERRGQLVSVPVEQA